jgi:hypothetical protein
MTYLDRLCRITTFQVEVDAGAEAAIRTNSNCQGLSSHSCGWERIEQAQEARLDEVVCGLGRRDLWDKEAKFVGGIDHAHDCLGCEE